MSQKSNSEEYDSSFSKENRLASPGEFKAVFQAAKKISSCNFAFYFKKNSLKYSRLGIVIAKRNVRKAITRNLVKRILRESFRFNQTRLNNFDIIIVVYKAFALLSKEEMRKVVDREFRRVRDRQGAE